ncbi:hypothetical protein CHS0354_035320 [Potamilus streckersoni]|uniref:Pyridine nucleotide-disulfide oxidoreductase n=1 Tax=Potamilus streckersoni TaxID=2493646 RepID=A0AAE0S345_9BIVA|nr:hypothetical protein CHS0354_035320 [Potamilus streckersoni]
MNSTLPYNHIKNDLVLIGAGHANLKVLKTLAMSPPSGTRITLITDVMQTPYSGMMHGYIAGHFMQNETHIDVNRLCKKLNVRILHSSVTGIDPKKQMIFCDNRPPVSYDYLSINCGSVQNNDTIPGAAEYALSVRPLQIKNCRGIFHLVIAGGGPTGVEMSIALRAKINYAMRDMNLIPDTVKVFLCIPDAHVLPGMSKKAVETIEAYIREHRITILNNSRLTAVEKDYVYMTDRKQIAADAVVLATGSGAPEWIVNTDLDTDKNGFICVKKTLQTLKYDNIFAGGDIVSIQGEKTDKSGVYAVRMADSIIYNIHAVISKRACKSYIPQKKAMYILGMEKDFGVLVRGNLAFSAPWVKKLKDYIDRKYVKSFSYPALKDIKLKRTPEDSMMRCGGCGGKVGKALLSDMLCNIKSAAHPDIMLGLNDYSDTACIQVAPDKYLYQSVDFFRELTDDLYLFGKITALHCLNDIYASGATPHSALAVMEYLTAGKNQPA